MMAEKRLIDAEELKKQAYETSEWDGGGFHQMVVDVEDIDDAPTIDAVPVVHGHWIHTGLTNVYGGHQHKCSVCGYELMVSPACDNENYCCNCGAKMDEGCEQDEQDPS